jgi:hypothetical protein
MQLHRKIAASVGLAVVALGQAAWAQTPVGEADNVLGPGIFTLFERAFSAHGVAADKRVAFINEGFFEPQVHVLERLTRRALGSLPEPAGGFGWPFYIRVRNVEDLGLLGSRGQVVLLDSPPPEMFGIPSPSYVHVYAYEYHPLNGFQAELLETHALPVNTNPPWLPANGLIFPSSFEFLPDGIVAIIDLFSIWIADASLSNWHMAWTSPDFGLTPLCSTVTHEGEEVPGFYLAVRDENWNKVRLPYQLRVQFPEPVLPAFKGITYIHLTDQVAIVRVQTSGGIFTIDRTTLVDDSLPPEAKPYSTLVAPEIGLSDLSGDLVYDHYHPDSKWVYWQRTPSESGQSQCEGAHPHAEKWSPIYRVNVLSGEIELVSENWILYDFPTVLSVIEPLGHDNPYTPQPEGRSQWGGPLKRSDSRLSRIVPGSRWLLCDSQAGEYEGKRFRPKTVELSPGSTSARHGDLRSA